MLRSEVYQRDYPGSGHDRTYTDDGAGVNDEYYGGVSCQKIDEICRTGAQSAARDIVEAATPYDDATAIVISND